MATFMAARESSIVATAMPTIVAELGGFHLFSWAFAAYLLPQGGDDPDLWAPRRSLRPQTRLFRWGGAVPVHLDLVRPRLGHAAAGAVPGTPRGGSRRDPADCDHHHRRHLSADRTCPGTGLHFGRL